MKIVEELASLAKPVDMFKVDRGNVRMHDEAGVEAIMSSLRQFGQQKPIVYYDFGPDGLVVIAGNGTLVAARKLGFTHIAAVQFRGSAEEARAFAIADNRTGELSFWDEKKLKDELDALTSGGGSGFVFDSAKLKFDDMFKKSTDDSFLDKFIVLAGEDEGSSEDKKTPAAVSRALNKRDPDTGEEYVTFAVRITGSQNKIMLEGIKRAKHLLPGGAKGKTNVEGLVHVFQYFLDNVPASDNEKLADKRASYGQKGQQQTQEET